MTERGARALVVAAFVGSRVAFWSAGGFFDASPLSWFYQFLAADWLRTRLAESLFYLHAQPPLFNLYLGLVLKACGEADVLVFQLVALAGGIGLALGLYALLRRCAVPVLFAAFVSGLFTVSPPAILFENWLFYTHWIALALVAAGLALERVVRLGRTRDLAAYAVLVAGVALTRSSFHLFWVIGAMAIPYLALRSRRWTTRAITVLPVAAVLVLYLKNLLVFGFFGASSWMGLGLARLTTAALPEAERRQWVAEGKLSPGALIPTFPGLPSVEIAGLSVEGPFQAIPVLALARKPSGAVNYNHAGWIEFARDAKQNAQVVIRDAPAVYLGQVARAAAVTFFPACDYPLLLAEQRLALAGWEHFFDRFVGGRVSYDVQPLAWIHAGRPLGPLLGNIGFGILAVYAIGLTTGIGDLARHRGEPAERALLAFAIFTILWVIATGALLEIGENNRFRFEVDALAVMLFARAAVRIVRRAA